MQRRTVHCLLALVGLLSIQSAHAGNLLSNPAFEDGNTGFECFYTYFTGSPLPEGRCVVASSPRLHHRLQADFGDHTTGKGLMLIVNGGTLSNVYDYPFWRETVAVDQGKNYSFTGWTTSADAYDSSPARLAASINGHLVMPEFQVPAVGHEWVQFSFNWNAEDYETATISLFSLNTAYNGNDFVIDDLSFDESSSVPALPPAACFAIGLLGLVTAMRRKSKGSRVRKAA